MAEPFGFAPVDPLTGAPTPTPEQQAKLQRIFGAIGGGLLNTIEAPGRAMREGITTEDAVSWAAPMALGMVGTPGVPGGALGSSARAPLRAPLPMDEASRMARAKDLGFTTEAYHGTLSPTDFSAFKRRQNDVGIHFGTPGQANDRLDYLRSINFTDPRAATSVSGDARMFPAMLKLKNPLRLEDAGWWSPDNLAEQLRKSGTIDPLKIDRAMYYGYTENPRSQLKALRDLIEGEGYDGIVYRNAGETTGAAPLRAETQRLDALAQGKPVSDVAHQRAIEARERETAFREANAEDSYVVFRPNQVRSRFAAFDPSKSHLSDLLASLAAVPAAGAAFGSLAPGEQQ